MNDMTCPKGCEMVEPLMERRVSKYNSSIEPKPYKVIETFTCPMCGFQFKEVEIKVDFP
jgi:transcription elongation factor Elf1